MLGILFVASGINYLRMACRIEEIFENNLFNGYMENKQKAKMDYNHYKSIISMLLKIKIFFVITLLKNPLLTFSQSISPSTFNSIGTSFQTSYAGMDINIGEPITGQISNANSQITQGLLQPNNFTLNLKFYIEGFYTGNGLMNNGGLGGCLYKLGASSNPNDVDSVRLTLIDKTTHEPIETSTAILKTDGTVNFYFHGATEGYYFLKLNHRNSIETWSSNLVLLTNEGNYDFTLFQNRAYGNNMIETFDQMGWAIFSGDISDAATGTVGIQDGVVESQDYSDMESAVPITLLGYHGEDITGDGVVESDDYSLMENAVYYTRAVIKP